MPILTSPVFLLSGPSRAGKTSLAKEIMRIVGGSFVSFGDQVRSVAASARGGSGLSRKRLQDLGQRLVERDPRNFCAAVVEGAAGRAADPLVVDGLRHLSLLPILEELLPGRDINLIFVESSPGIRKSRWNGQPSEDEILAVDSHPVEADLGQLRQRANLIIETSEGMEPALTKFADWLAIKYPNLIKMAAIPAQNH